jgi:hypothetical protein
MKETLRRQNVVVISRQVSPASLLDVSAGNCQRTLVDESGMIIKADGVTQQIRNGRGKRVVFCDHPIEASKLFSWADV